MRNTSSSFKVEFTTLADAGQSQQVIALLDETSSVAAHARQRSR
jgi:hypothetical protein